MFRSVCVLQRKRTKTVGFYVKDLKRAIQRENIKGLVEADTLFLILATQPDASQQLHEASDRRGS